MSTLSAELTQKLIDETVGCQLHQRKPCFKRENSSSERQAAAHQFGADGNAVGFGRIWLDRKHAKIRPILAIFNSAVTDWRRFTHFYPHDGIRLCNTSLVDHITNRIEELKGQLHMLCAQADNQLSSIKAERQEKLGSLYRPDDFFASFSDVFQLWVSWPQLMPDERLLELNPAVYEAAQAKVQADFQVALSSAQDALLDEFTKLVKGLSDTLNGRADGQKRRFTEASVNNLKTFLERFQTLNVGGQPELEQLIAQANDLVEGTTAAAMKKDHSLEGGIRAGLNEICSALPNVIEYQPERDLVLDEEEDGEDGPPLDDTNLSPDDIPSHLVDSDEEEPPFPFDEEEGELVGATDNGLGLGDLDDF